MYFASACSTWQVCWQVSRALWREGPLPTSPGEPRASCAFTSPLPLPTGSLTVSITDMRAPVVGGSGGVYALCSAHLANVVMVMGPPFWGGGKGPTQHASQPVCLPPSELGWDAVSIQAAEDGAGSGVQ